MMKDEAKKRSIEASFRHSFLRIFFVYSFINPEPNSNNYNRIFHFTTQQ